MADEGSSDSADEGRTAVDDDENPDVSDGESPVVAEDKGPNVADEKSPLPTLRSALRAVRREAWKAGLVYAVVDAAVTATVVTLLLTTVQISAVPETIRVPLPSVLVGPVEALTGVTTGTAPISGAVAIGLGAAVVGFLAELVFVSRRDPITWFESVNPDLGAALRTARDTAEDGAEDVMAGSLYREVLDRLRSASGVAMLDRNGLALRLLVAVLVVFGAGGIAALGVSLNLPVFGGGGGSDQQGGRPGQNDGQPGGGGAPDNGGQGPGRDILGDPVDVPRGEIPDDVVVDPGGSTGGSDRPYETGGFPSGSVSVEAEPAGYAPPEVLADADLVRAYSIAIRTGNVTGGGGGG